MTMKKKTIAFADALINNPRLSGTTAYLVTHETDNRASARVNASQLLAKPEVQIYMQKHVDKAKKKIVQLVDSDREEIALKASESILDRNLGKALTRTNSLNVDISIETALNQLI